MSKEGRILAVAGFVVVAIAVGLALKAPQDPGAQEPIRVSKTPAARAAVSSAKSPGPSELAKSPGSWRAVEKGLPYLHRKDVSWFLKRARISSFEAELDRAVKIGDPASRALQPDGQEEQWLNGCYAGTVKLDDGRKWSMTTRISFEKESMDVVLSEDGTIFLNSIGGDGLGDLRKPDGGSAAILLEASENIFFQLYPVRGADAVGGLTAGNAYLRSGSGKIGFAGTLLLEKKGCPHD